MQAIAAHSPGSSEPRNRTVVLIPDRVYRIEVRYGTSAQCVDNLTLSVGDDRTAGVIHRAMNAAYDAGMNDEQVRAEVLDALRYEFGNVAKLRPRAVHAAYLADLDRAMGIFEPASTPGRLAALGREVAEMAVAR